MVGLRIVYQLHLGSHVGGPCGVPHKGGLGVGEDEEGPAQSVGAATKAADSESQLGGENAVAVVEGELCRPRGRAYAVGEQPMPRGAALGRVDDVERLSAAEHYGNRVDPLAYVDTVESAELVSAVALHKGYVQQRVATVDGGHKGVDGDRTAIVDAAIHKRVAGTYHKGGGNLIGGCFDSNQHHRAVGSMAVGVQNGYAVRPKEGVPLPLHRPLAGAEAAHVAHRLVGPDMQHVMQRGVAARGGRDGYGGVGCAVENNAAPCVRQLVFHHGVAHLGVGSCQHPAADGLDAGGGEAVDEVAVVEAAVGADGDALHCVDGGGSAVAVPAVAEAVGGDESHTVALATAHGIMALQALEVVVAVAPAVVDDAVCGGDAEPDTLPMVGAKIEGHAGEIAPPVHAVHLVPPRVVPHVDVEAVASFGLQLCHGVVEQFNAEPCWVQRIIVVGHLRALESSESHSHGVFHHQQVGLVGVDGDGVEHGVSLPVAQAVA